jgi:hypothetical protein
VPAESSGEFVEILSRAILSFFENQLEGAEIGIAFRQLSGGELDQLNNMLAERPADAAWRCGGRVQHVLPGAARGQEARLFERGELGGDSGLSHPQDGLEFSDGQFLPGEQAKDAQAGGVREKSERFHG